MAICCGSAANGRPGAKPGAQSTFLEGNAEDLPLPDDHFDAYTIAFGIRNVPRIDKALGEAYRVLKRGGRFLVLEFSRVDTPLLDRLYDAYSVDRHSGARQSRHRRWRALSLSRRIDPPFPDAPNVLPT